MKLIRVLALVVFFVPSVLSAQSLEWLAEHPGSSTPALAVVTTPAVVNTNDGLEQKVRAYFSDALIMAEIARCESRFRQFTDSGNPLDGGSGGMIGLYQINSHVHADFARSLGMDIYAVDGNLAYARYLYQKEGTDPWLSSFSCWHHASTTNETPSSLTHDLILGIIHPEVRALQTLLNAKGFVLAAEGPGSPGQETDKFGSLTRSALRKFQCAVMQICSGNEHSTGYGMLNLPTRNALVAGAATTVSRPADDTAEIERLTKLIAELTAELFALKQKQS